MISSFYRQLLLVISISPLTKVCAYTTPWSPAANHVCQPNETLSSLQFSPSQSTTINFEGPSTTALSGPSPQAVPVPLLLPLASVHTTSSPSISPRRPQRPVSHLLSLITLSLHSGWNTSTISPGLLQTSAPTALSLSEPRADLSTHTALHGPSSSYTHWVQGKDSPGAWAHISPTIYTHTQVDLPISRPNCSLSRLVVLRANSYGIPPWKFQISKLRICACLMQIAANLVKAPLPPLDLHSTSCFAISTVSFQPSFSAPFVLKLCPPSSPQDNLLSCSRFHRCAILISLVLDDGKLRLGRDRRRRQASALTSSLSPSPTDDMTSLSAAASALATANNAPSSPQRAYASFKDALLSPSRKHNDAPAAAPVISPEDQPGGSISPLGPNQTGKQDASLTGASSSESTETGALSSSATATAVVGVQPPHTPRGSASNSFCRKVREGKIAGENPDRAAAKTYAYAYWSPSAPENKTGVRIDKDGEKRLRLTGGSLTGATEVEATNSASGAPMEINSPGRVNYKAGSDQLVRLVQEHSGHEELSTDLSVHSANSEADSLAPLVQEAVDDLASLDDDTSGGTATAEAKPAGIKPVTRDYAAEKAAIEVDDESSSGTSQGPTDQCTLSSDESSFDENEQLLIQASKKSTHTSAQSKITRFASNLPKPSRGTDTKSKPVRSDFVPNAVKINRTAQPNPAQQTTTTFKKSLLVTNGGNGLRRSSRLDAAFTQSISAASYEGLADMEDKNTAAHTELDWPSIFSTLLAETTSSTDPMESFSHPKQGPFRIVNSLSGPVLVNRRGIRLFHLGKEHHIDTAPPVSDFMFDAECEFTMKSLEQIDRDRVTRRLQDKVKEHGGDTRSPAHPDNGPFSILRQPEWGTKTLWVLNSKGEQVQ
jgi:hypothetical protein